MKKFYFLFLFALIASISNLYAAEKTVTSTFKDKDLTVGVGEPGWVASITANSFESNNNNRGVQFGAAKGAFTLKTSESFSQVKKVSVILSTNEKVNTVSLKVGGTSVDGMKTLSKRNNYAVNWSVVSPQDGIIEFSFNDKKGSIYIKSISITYEFVETKCAKPTFNLTADATYTDAQDLVITSTTEGAQIEYTITGDKLTTPITGTEASPATIHLTANDIYLVSAKATKAGLEASESEDLMFTIAKKMNKPTFNLTEGAVYGEAKVLEITSDKVGAQIEYTVIGGGNISITKTEASPVKVTLNQNGDYTVEAFALGMDDYAKSDAAGLNFRIELAAGVPTFSVEEGTYPEAQTIALAPGEGGEKVFYTINGGTEQPFIEPIKLEEDGTYKIAAYTAGTETLAKSATVIKTYVINLPLEEPYILCEDAAWLTEGAKVIFVGKNLTKGGTFGMASQGSNDYRGQGVVTLSEDGNFLNDKEAEVRVFSVERSGAKMAFKDVEGYLYTDNAKNSIKTKKTITDDCYWTVSIGTDNVASVVSSSLTKNTDYRNIKYNASSDRFAAYNDKYEGKVYIYLLGKTSSVSSMSAEGVKVFAAEGGVEVVAAEATDVAVYTVAGQLVRQARVAEGSTLVNVAPGFYVVRANGTATKVIVR